MVFIHGIMRGRIHHSICDIHGIHGMETGDTSR